MSQSHEPDKEGQETDLVVEKSSYEQHDWVLIDNIHKVIKHVTQIWFCWPFWRLTFALKSF